MDQQAYQRMVTMLNDFPSGTEDKDLRLRSFEDVLSDIPSSVIADTARRYSSGEINGQSLDFAPTPAQFRQEAKRLADLCQYRDKPRLPPPVRKSGGHAPFEIRSEQLRQKYARREVLKTDVSYDRWRAISKDLPQGHTWIGALNGTVFGPEPKED